MDVYTQQFLVREHMNDRLAEARMARLAREARSGEHAFAVARAQVEQRPSALTRLVAGLFSAAATVGNAIAPTPPVQVRVVRR